LSNGSRSIDLEVNGKLYRGINIRPYDTLSRVLRDELGLIGTKRGCDYGGCGACTVALDNMAIYSCMYPAQYAVNKKILTVEGLESISESSSSLSEIQKSFLENGGLQCGYCTSGMMISAKVLLEANPKPEQDDIQEALAGNICRCTGYGTIIKSVLEAAKRMEERR
jgi:aerobic carbon-monoxide dehydrogenase small subunit